MGTGSVISQGSAHGSATSPDLGVDALWLTPFYPSPQYDHGYDVADYFGVEPDYGDLADFDRLVDAAHALDIQVLDGHRAQPLQLAAPLVRRRARCRSGRLGPQPVLLPRRPR